MDAIRPRHDKPTNRHPLTNSAPAERANGIQNIPMAAFLGSSINHPDPMLPNEHHGPTWTDILKAVSTVFKPFTQASFTHAADSASPL